ncbi:type II secretion system protein GspD [Rhabdochromatium marinum]|nr:type II secretion system protein GspD [Rhabdochromatium marinum]
MAAVVMMLVTISGCSTFVWDPSHKVGAAKGHIIDEEKAGFDPGAQTQPLRRDGIALDEERGPGLSEGIERGTGVFVQNIERPTVDTTPGDVTLNFDGTDIREVVKVILGDLLGVNYVLDPAVQGSASLQTGRPLRRDLLIPTLETLLRMNNAALVDKGGTYEVVPLAKAVRGRLAPQLGTSNKALPPGYSVQIIPLRYIGAKEMANILEPLAPEGSLVRVDSLRNLLVVAASGPEMSNLMDTIDVFDVDWMAGLSVGFFTLEYAQATEVVSQVEELLAGESGDTAKGLFRLIPVDSANAIMVVAPQARYLEKMQDWIERLDQAEASGSSAQRLFVYRVKHGEAENLANMLSQLFAGSGGSTGTRRSVGGVAPGTREASIGGDGQSNGGTTGTASRNISSSTLDMSSEVSIVADTVNNSLLVRSSPRDYKKILDALKQLDIVPLQVLVEATIIEVRLSGSLRYGVSWNFLAGPKTEGDYRNDIAFSGSESGAMGPTWPGFNWSVVVNPETIRSTLSALAADDLVNVLSSPSVMVMDNQEAKIQVGDEVPIKTREQQDTTNTSSLINEIEYKSTGVILTVTPRVTPGGLVQMEIEQEVSSVNRDEGEVDSPSFRTRKINSNVAVRSNQAVVLGGLIQDDREDSKTGVPGFYRVPVFGALFGDTSRSAKRSELIVVLTPRVIASDTDIDAVTEHFRGKVQNLKNAF